MKSSSANCIDTSSEMAVECMWVWGRFQPKALRLEECYADSMESKTHPSTPRSTPQKTIPVPNTVSTLPLWQRLRPSPAPSKPTDAPSASGAILHGSTAVWAFTSASAAKNTIRSEHCEHWLLEPGVRFLVSNSLCF
jgi:hypothetical protein